MGPYILLKGGSNKNSHTHHRAKGVWRFPNVELLVVPLSFSCSHIIDDSIAPNVAHGLGFPDLEPTFANDHSDLPFIVHSVCKSRMRVDWLSVSNNACGTFGENNGVRWLICFVAGVVTRRVKFDGMLEIVFTNREDVSAANGSLEFY